MEPTNSTSIEKDLSAVLENDRALSEADLEKLAGGNDPCEGGQLRRR